MNWMVPAARETFDVELEDGASIRVRRHGNPDGPRLTVTHGNGFAADAYLPFWQQLSHITMSWSSTSAITDRTFRPSPAITPMRN